MSLTEELLLRLEERDFKTRIISAEHLPSLQEEVVGKYKQGLFDEEFYQERLAWFKFQPPESMPNPKSIIVTAVPRPQTQATFTWKNKQRSLLLPPTYTAYDEITTETQKLVANILKKKGYKAAPTDLPLKLLATRSGLGQYGRNNISYVPDMGSFHLLVGVYSDMPCQKDNWQEAMMMQACDNCQLCRKACPTIAIPSDRFLLRAERCIVYHNEKKGNIPFPDWIKPSMHNCVVGCLHCQRACPVNKRFIQWIGEKEEFSEEETALFLAGAKRDQLSAATVKKLENLSLVDYLENLPRNLGVFFK